MKGIHIAEEEEKVFLFFFGSHNIIYDGIYKRKILALAEYRNVSGYKINIQIRKTSSWKLNFLLTYPNSAKVCDV